MRRLSYGAFLFAVLLTSGVLRAAVVKVNAEDKDEVVIAGQNFASARFGMGLSVTSDLRGDSRVDEAEVVNGIVRIKEDSDVRARVMFETHIFAKGFKYLPVVEEQDADEPRISADNGADDDAPMVPMVGLGPFVAVQPGSDEIIEAVALGVMMGWRRSQSLKSSSSLNIGVGYVVDPNTQVLGEGIEANEALPPGETEVRFRKTNQGGILIVASFSF